MTIDENVIYEFLMKSASLKESYVIGLFRICKELGLNKYDSLHMVHMYTSLPLPMIESIIDDANNDSNPDRV